VAHATPDVKAFAHLAALEFEGPILRYSRRLALLRLAEKMNIGRFEANLMIALIQHRLNEEMIPDSHNQEASPRPSAFARLLPLITFLVVQSAIIWGTWRIFASF
jgi:hypothetical protein